MGYKIERCKNDEIHMSHDDVRQILISNFFIKIKDQRSEREDLSFFSM